MKWIKKDNHFGKQITTRCQFNLYRKANKMQIFLLLFNSVNSSPFHLWLLDKMSYLHEIHLQILEVQASYSVVCPFFYCECHVFFWVSMQKQCMRTAKLGALSESTSLDTLKHGLWLGKLSTKIKKPNIKPPAIPTDFLSNKIGYQGDEPIFFFLSVCEGPKSGIWAKEGLNWVWESFWNRFLKFYFKI